MHQLTLESAVQSGERGMSISMEHAVKRDPLFAEKAEKAILGHLQVVQQAPGEDLVDIAKAKGAVAPDDRAFGGVFQSMSRRGLIRTVGYALRRKGHSGAGGRVWGLVL